MAPADEATMGEQRAGDRPIAPRPAVDDVAQGAGSGSRPGGKRASGLAVLVRPPVRCWLLHACARGQESRRHRRACRGCAC